MKKVVLYSRTSHWESNPQNQINELKQVANRFGWTIIKEYTDKGKLWVRYVSPTPATVVDVLKLKNVLEKRLESG